DPRRALEELPFKLVHLPVGLRSARLAIVRLDGPGVSQIQHQRQSGRLGEPGAQHLGRVRPGVDVDHFALLAAQESPRAKKYPREIPAVAVEGTFGSR